jgi:hypothetical protein
LRIFANRLINDLKSEERIYSTTTDEMQYVTVDISVLKINESNFESIKFKSIILSLQNADIAMLIAIQNSTKIHLHQNFHTDILKPYLNRK